MTPAQINPATAIAAPWEADYRAVTSGQRRFSCHRPTICGGTNASVGVHDGGTPAGLRGVPDYLAASQGNGPAAQNRDQASSLMTASQIEKAKALATARKPKTGQ